MPQDLVSMQITQEQEDQVMALFAQLETLLPGLITLSIEERKGLSMLGPKSERYVRANIGLANDNAGMIPPDIDLRGANDDLAARERMQRISSRARKFSDKCEDTTDALGSDLMVVSHLIYAILKVLGKASGIEDAVRELGYRWARKKRKTEAALPEG